MKKALFFVSLIFTLSLSGCSSWWNETFDSSDDLLCEGAGAATSGTTSSSSSSSGTWVTSTISSGTNVYYYFEADTYETYTVYIRDKDYYSSDFSGDVYVYLLTYPSSSSTAYSSDYSSFSYTNSSYSRLYLKVYAYSSGKYSVCVKDSSGNMVKLNPYY